MAAASEHMMPPQFFKYLSLLQDKAKHLPYSEIEIILKKELKEKFNDIISIEQNPIASASIA